MIVYLLLSGTEQRPGADILTSLFTESDVNPIFGSFTDKIEDLITQFDYDESYSKYEKLNYEHGEFKIIDFDENGKLVFE